MYDEQVRPAVIVDIGPDDAPAGAVVIDAGDLGHVGKGVVAIVTEQHLHRAFRQGIATGDQEIQVTVKIKVGGCDAVRVALIIEVGLVGGVAKAAVGVIKKELVVPIIANERGIVTINLATPLPS